VVSCIEHGKESAGSKIGGEILNIRTTLKKGPVPWI
jgi:hypothetical protein